MLNNKVREIRKNKAKISMLELSRQTKISPSDLCLIETGRIVVYSGWKKRIAEALQETIDSLFPIDIRNE